MEKILVVDDEIEVTELLEEFLVQSGYQVATANSKKSAQAKISEFQPGIILLDIKLPDGDGVQFLKEIKASYPNIEIIMITGMADREIALEAIKSGAADYICKPIDLAYLANSVFTKVVTRFTE